MAELSQYEFVLAESSVRSSNVRAQPIHWLMTANTLAELSQYIGKSGVVSGQCIGQRRVGTYSWSHCEGEWWWAEWPVEASLEFRGFFKFTSCRDRGWIRFPGFQIAQHRYFADVTTHTCAADRVADRWCGPPNPPVSLG